MKNKNQKEIEEFLNERSWNNHLPSDLAKSICIESAELLEIFQWSNDSAIEVKKNKKAVEMIADELADVFIYSYELLIILGLDINTIISKKMRKNRLKYPVTRTAKEQSEGHYELVHAKRVLRKKNV